MIKRKKKWLNYSPREKTLWSKYQTLKADYPTIFKLTTNALIYMPLVIAGAYWYGVEQPIIATPWSIGDLFVLYGVFLAFLGTVSLGVLSLWQNQRFKDENDKSQNVLQELMRKQNQKNYLELCESLKEKVEALFYVEELKNSTEKNLTLDEIQLYYTNRFKEIEQINRKITSMQPEFLVSDYYHHIKSLRFEFTSNLEQENSETPYEIFSEYWKKTKSKTVQIGHDFVWDILEKEYKIYEKQKETPND